MPSSLIGSLRVALGLDTAQFESGANRARQKARTTASGIEASFNSAKTAVTGLFAAFTVGFLAAEIKKSLDYAGSIREVSKTLGVTTKDLQTFRFAAQQNGVAQDELEVGLRRLTVTIGKAELGSKAQADAFKAIGISVEQLKGKNTGDVFRLIADGLSKVTDRSQRAAIEMILMGRSGSTLDNLLAPGSKRLNELADAAERLGIVLSDQQIQGAEETAHKLEAVKTVLEAQIAGVVANNASAILSLSSALATLTGEIVRFLGSNPQLALGIIGALLGGRVGGLPGAAAGALGGAYLGKLVGQSAADSNMDLAFRMQQVRDARARYLAAKQAPDLGGRVLPGIGIAASSGGSAGVAAAEKELRRQTALLLSADAAFKAQRQSTAPGVNLPSFLGGGGAGRTRASGRAPADRSDEVTAQFAQEQLQADQSILRAKQQLAGSAEDRAKIELQLIALDAQIQDAQINERVSRAEREFAEGKITKTALQEVEQQASILKQKANEETQIRLRAFIEEQLTRQEQALFEANDQRYKWTIDALHSADEMANTQADHRRIQLQILDAEIEQRRLELQHTKDLAIRNGATQQEIDNIQAQIDHLAVERAQGAAGIVHNTQSPLESYFSNLPHTANQINEALQSIEVEGIQGLSSALAQAGKGWGAMRDAAIQALDQIAQQLIQLGIQRLLFNLFGNAVLGGAGGGLGSSATLSAVGLASGGFVSGSGSSTSDSIPAMLSNGEYVMSAAAVGRIGLPFLDAMNAGNMAHRKGGGLLGALSFLSPAALFATHLGKNFNPFALISPGAFLASKALSRDFNPLALLSPGAFAASKLFDGKGANGGHTFNINVAAPNTGNQVRDRQTSLQQATDIRLAIADAAAKGLI